MRTRNPFNAFNAHMYGTIVCVLVSGGGASSRRGVRERNDKVNATKVVPRPKGGIK